MGLWDAVSRMVDAARFLSRLPLPEAARPPGPLAVTLRAAPVAGLLIGAGPALLLWAASRAGLADLATAALAIAALALVTGGLHEDGLADVADGFGGGATVTRKLAIMRDSRIGAFGALALGATLLLRVAALQGLLGRLGPEAAALALLGAAAVSRGLMLVPLALLPAARPDGLAHAAGPDGAPILPMALPAAALLGAGLAAVASPDRIAVLAALVAAAAGALAVTRAADHNVRGVTGDVIGATQQVTEIIFLLVLCAAAGPR